MRIFGWRSAAMNMCSVRHSPMPSAPNSSARRASSGVSALARTPRVRSSSAHPSTVSNCSLIAASTSGTSSVVTAPLDPSIAIRSPSWSTVPFTRTSPPCRSISSSAAPVTAGRPIPRATSAACEALPPSEVRIPAAASNPATSSASVNGRTRIMSTPRPAAPRRRLGGEHDRPLGGAGRGGHAAGEYVVFSGRDRTSGAAARRALSASIVAIAWSRRQQPLVRPRRPRTARRPAPGAWRCASGA